MEKYNETYCNTTATAYNCVVNTCFTIFSSIGFITYHSLSYVLHIIDEAISLFIPNEFVEYSDIVP